MGEKQFELLMEMLERIFSALVDIENEIAKRGRD